MKNKMTLKNNVILINDVNNYLHTAKITIFFRVGTLYENKSNNGISHLVEHMFFRKLFDLNQKDLYYKTESIGSFLHGQTSSDFVCFDIGCVPKYFCSAVDIISKLLFEFEWNDSDIFAEKNVVCKQIDLKNLSVEEYRDNYYFTGTKYSYPIMGTNETIRRINKDQINKWKKKYFNCDNCCVVITGAVSDEDLQYALEKFGNIKNAGQCAEPPKILLKHFFTRSIFDDKIIPSYSDVSDVSIFFDIDIKKIKIEESEIIMNMLCKGDGSRLIYLLRDKLCLAEYIDSWINLYNGFARMCISYSVKNSDLILSLNETFNEIKNFKETQSTDEFKATIPFFTDNIPIIKDNVSELGFNYGWYDFILGLDYDIDNKIRYNCNLNEKKILTTTQKLLSSDNMTIIVDNNRRICKKSDLLMQLENIRRIIG